MGVTTWDRLQKFFLSPLAMIALKLLTEFVKLSACYKKKTQEPLKLTLLKEHSLHPAAGLYSSSTG